MSQSRRASIIFILLFATPLLCHCVVDDPEEQDGDAGVGEECVENLDCRDLLDCVSGTCQPRGVTAEGGYCELSADCQDGLYCSYARSCAPAGESSDNQGCGTTADCEAGLVCVLEGFTGRCRPAGEGDIDEECEDVTDCLPGLTCTVSAGSVYLCSSPERSAAPEPAPTLRPWLGEECLEDSGAPLAYFHVPRGDESDHDFYRLPFPNDIRLVEGHIDLGGHPHPDTALGGDLIERYLDVIEEDIDGFAQNPVVFFRFSAEHDYESIHDALTFVNITPDSPEYGEQRGYTWYSTHSSGSRYICQNWLGISASSGWPLRPGETYAVMLSDDLTPVGGGSFARSSDFEALLTDAEPDDSVLGHAWQAYAPLRQWIADFEVDPATLLTAAVFTTQRAPSTMEEIHQVLQARAEPGLRDLTLCDEGVISPCDDGTIERTCPAVTSSFYELHGRLELPIFQDGEPPYELPEDGGGIAYRDDGAPRVVRTEDVCFAMTIPRVGSIPEGGFPVVVYGHGTGGSFRDAVRTGIAGSLAAGELDGAPVPVATLAIDLPQHGERRAGSELESDVLFFNFQNPRAARDNVIQGAADLSSLVRWATSVSISAEDSPTGQAIFFDPESVGLFGHSQGATHAALMLPFEERVLAVILSGEGGHLTLSLLNKTEPVDIASALPFALQDPDRDGTLVGQDQHPMLALFQTFFERSDPVNFGLPLWPTEESGFYRHIFMTYGLGDSYSPEATQRAYARSARLVLVGDPLTTNAEGEPDDLGLRTGPLPLVGNVEGDEQNWTVGVRQYAPEGDDDGHFVSTRTEEGRADTIRFLLQALSGMTPEIGTP